MSNYPHPERKRNPAFKLLEGEPARLQAGAYDDAGIYEPVNEPAPQPVDAKVSTQPKKLTA